MFQLSCVPVNSIIKISIIHKSSIDTSQTALSILYWQMLFYLKFSNFGFSLIRSLFTFEDAYNILENEKSRCIKPYIARQKFPFLELVSHSHFIHLKMLTTGQHNTSKHTKSCIARIKFEVV
jgi:hypothetical protein